MSTSPNSAIHSQETRASLLHLIATLSFRLGDFTLSSGAHSDYYIDCRTTTLHAEGGRLAGLALYDSILQHNLQPQAVGGLTMGADPLVSNIASASAWRRIKNPDAPLIHGFLVRKTEKTHGTGRRIEGFCEAGARVVIVDDVCTTGASTIQAMDAARAAQMQVVGVLCLVDRQEQGGRASVEAATQGAPFLPLFTAEEVRTAHIAATEKV
ncbi:MAG: orotate phosphoribosyltransferase [Acidobacteriaceae bacterium]